MSFDLAMSRQVTKIICMCTICMGLQLVLVHYRAYYYLNQVISLQEDPPGPVLVQAFVLHQHCDGHRGLHLLKEVSRRVQPKVHNYRIALILYSTGCDKGIA